MAEAATQDFVAQYLDDNNVSTMRAPRIYLAFMRGDFGYIAMEYVDGEVCDKSDDSLIAAAVNDLFQIRGTSSKPGPFGGGLIEHPFFMDRLAPIEYAPVKELERHINNVRAFPPALLLWFCPGTEL